MSKVVMASVAQASLLLAVICAVVIAVHAFRRSLATGVLVTFIPFFIYYYAFAQFEHRYKGALVSAFLAASGLVPLMGLAVNSNL